MADSALFIGWGATAAGRERKAVELFGESLRFLTEAGGGGARGSVEPFFLEPHGGRPRGVLPGPGGSGGAGQASATTDDFQRLAVRAQVVVSNFGVVGAITGEQAEQAHGLVRRGGARAAIARLERVSRPRRVADPVDRPARGSRPRSSRATRPAWTRCSPRAARPQLLGGGSRVRDVEAVQDAGAVADQRAGRRSGPASSTSAPAGPRCHRTLPVSWSTATRPPAVSGARRRRPCTARACRGCRRRARSPPICTRPHQRVVRLAGVELHEARRPACVARLRPGRDVERAVPAHVQVALVVDDDRRVGLVAVPEPEHPLVVRPAVQDVADVPALDQPAGVREVHDPVAERHRVLDRHAVVAEVAENSCCVVAGDEHHDLRVDLDQAVGVVAGGSA